MLVLLSIRSFCDPHRLILLCSFLYLATHCAQDRLNMVCIAIDSLSSPMFSHKILKLISICCYFLHSTSVDVTSSNIDVITKSLPELSIFIPMNLKLINSSTFSYFHSFGLKKEALGQPINIAKAPTWVWGEIK